MEVSAADEALISKELLLGRALLQTLHLVMHLCKLIAANLLQKDELKPKTKRKTRLTIDSSSVTNTFTSSYKNFS